MFHGLRADKVLRIAPLTLEQALAAEAFLMVFGVPPEVAQHAGPNAGVNQPQQAIHRNPDEQDVEDRAHHECFAPDEGFDRFLRDIAHFADMDGGLVKPTACADVEVEQYGRPFLVVVVSEMPDVVD